MDSDLDGLADGQEAILGTNPLLNDTDKDGIVDRQEIAQGTNPLAVDSDLDGLTDGQEASLNTNPLLKDTDKDGLTDGTEVTLGTNPLLRDTDKDGIADAQEVAQGTDPLTVTCSGRDRGTCFGLTGCQWCEMKLECMESTRFLAECRASTCPDIKSLSFCNSHALCAWKDNKCVSNIFGGGRNNDNRKKGCMRLNNRRQAIKCLKKKRRKCNKKRNSRKRNQCVRKVTKKIRQVKKNFRSRFLRESSDDHRPKMYTFYRRVEIGAANDTDVALLDLWREEWTRAGFDAKILTLDNAKAHPSFASYQKTLHENTTLHTPLEYNYMCFYRWLAMAAIGGGFMSDNDVLPLQGSYDLAKEEFSNGGKFTVYERHVPSLLSGTADEWSRLAHEILNVAIAQSRGTIAIADNSGKTSDMLALLPIVEGGNNVVVHPDIVLGNPGDLEQMDESTCTILQNKPAVHFSHAAIGAMHLNINMRPTIMRDWIGRWRELCSTRTADALNVSTACCCRIDLHY